MALSRLLARPMLASMFIVGGLDSVRNASKKAAAAEPVTDKLVPLLQRVVSSWSTAAAPDRSPRSAEVALALTGVSAISGVAPPDVIRELAATVVFLASDAAGYVTGQTIPVDGGMTIS